MKEKLFLNNQLIQIQQRMILQTIGQTILHATDPVVSENNEAIKEEDEPVNNSLAAEQKNWFLKMKKMISVQYHQQNRIPN